MKVKKKGFTITELVIVIAVIAILAAVLIPTFSNVIEKANESAASSACSIAVTEYITMVTLDSDPDNNDATGVVFSNDNYYYVYSGGKLHYIGNTEKDSSRLLAVTEFDADISALTGFPKQSVEEGTPVYEDKIKFTIGEQSVEVDLTDTTRTLYLYNVDIDGATYAGFFTINNTYGGSGNVIQTVNYSYQCGIADSTEGITVGQAEVVEEVELVLESISAQFLSDVPIYVGDNKTIAPEEVKVTASYVGGIEQVLSSNLYTLENAIVTTDITGEHTVTVKYTENEIEKTATFTVTVVDPQPKKTIYYYNEKGWTTPYAYVWREEYINVQPAVGDFVLMGNILGTANAWTLDSSIKMFKETNAAGQTEYVVKGLRIANGQEFKIGRVASSDSADIWTLNSIKTDDKTAWTVQYPGQDAGFTVQLVGNDKNIVLTNSSGDSALYDIYWKNDKSVLYIAKSVDQTAENQPNVAIISTYPDEWPGVKMTEVEGNPGLWKVDVDARATFVVFNDGVKENPQIGTNKTADIEISSNAKNVYYFNDGWHSEYTMYYFYNAYNWNEVYANATTTEPIALMSTSTSTSTDIGIRMTAVEGKPGWFAVPVASGCDTIVFSDGTDTHKTEELTIDNTNVYYNPNNATADGGGWSSSIKTTIYYFYNAAGWEKVYAHYWTEGGPGTSWHGVEMTAVEGQDGWFSIEVDDNFKNIVFNDGIGEVEGVNKTADLTLNSSTPYFDGYEWKSEQTTHQATGHTPGSEWKSDENYHWHICSVCNGEVNKVAHTWDEGTVTTEPTCTTAGVKTFKCECGATKTEEIPMLQHNPDSEWSSDDTYHWHACSGCDEQLDKAEHVYDQTVATEEYLATAATCTDKATYYYSCECGAKGTETFESGEALGHAESEGWFTDETDHWKQCTRCQTELSKSAHTGGTATCSEQATCEICNHQYGEFGEHNFVNNVCQNCSAVKYYFYNYLNWTGTMSAYAWKGEEGSETKYLGDFPGTAMTPDTENEGWYYIVVNGDAEKIIFNNGKTAEGEKQQTDNLTIDKTKVYFSGGIWWESIDSMQNKIVLDLSQNTQWPSSNARFAVYLFNDSNTVWVDMEKVSDNYYIADISTLSFTPTTFIICRMNPEFTDNAWNTQTEYRVWNQTEDLSVSNGLCVKLPEGYWGKDGNNSQDFRVERDQYHLTSATK